eukprot:14988223-Ditylum_brightwellii.AAC.1
MDSSCGTCVNHRISLLIGLITAQHDELRDEVSVIGTQAYSQSAICDKPQINTGQNCCLQASNDGDNNKTVSPLLLQRSTESWEGRQK